MAKYGPEAHQAVEREMKEFKEGKLRSGSGEKVTNPKQAIAIGLSQARREGAKMPPAPDGTPSAAKEGADRKAAAKKKRSRTAASKKAAPGKSPTSNPRAKSTAKKSASHGAKKSASNK